MKTTRHDIRKADGGRSVVHITAGGHPTGSSVSHNLSFRVQDFDSGKGLSPRCSVCGEHRVTIRAKHDDLCGSCLTALAHGLNEAQKTTGERGKRYGKKES